MAKWRNGRHEKHGGWRAKRGGNRENESEIMKIASWQASNRKRKRRKYQRKRMVMAKASAWRVGVAGGRLAVFLFFCYAWAARHRRQQTGSAAAWLRRCQKTKQPQTRAGGDIALAWPAPAFQDSATFVGIRAARLMQLWHFAIAILLCYACAVMAAPRIWCVGRRRRWRRIDGAAHRAVRDAYSCGYRAGSGDGCRRRSGGCWPRRKSDVAAAAAWRREGVMWRRRNSEMTRRKLKHLFAHCSPTAKQTCENEARLLKRRQASGSAEKPV